MNSLVTDPPPPGSATPTERFAPTREPERIAILDIARGFALLGIVLVNVQFFIAPSTIVGLTELWWQTDAGKAADFVIRWLFEQKFYTLFAFLFGVGFALQSRRAAQRGAPFASVYRRRLWVLLLFGLLHITFIWYGDILTLYATVGFALLLFRNASNRFVLVTAAVCYLLPYFLLGLLNALGTMALLMEGPDGEVHQMFATAARDASDFAVLSVANYQRLPFDELIVQRMADLRMIAFVYLIMAPQVLALFLLGLVAGRQGWLWNWQIAGRYWRRLLWFGLPAGLLINLGYAWLRHESPGEHVGVSPLIQLALNVAGIPLLTAGYLAALVTLAQREVWLRRLAPLAAAGRMALTNYLLQSLICTTLAYSYGLALFGRVDLAPAAGFVVLLYLLQLAFSVAWLRRFRMGPFEWIWRTLTYGRPAPFRRRTPAARPAAL